MGADLNLIKLNILSDDVRVNTDVTYNLQGIQELLVTTMGSVLQDIQIGNSILPTKFQEVPMSFPIPQDGIMGRPLLEQLRAVIDCKQGKLTSDISNDKITVPARSQVVIPKCTTNVIGDNRYVLIHSQQLADDLFCGNLLNTVHNGQVLICIASSREESIQIESFRIEELSHQLLDEANVKNIFRIRKNDNCQNRTYYITQPIK